MSTIYRLPGTQPADQYEEREPVFPCWMWVSKVWNGKGWFPGWEHTTTAQGGFHYDSTATHWSPDAPTPPEERPEAFSGTVRVTGAISSIPTADTRGIKIVPAPQPPAVEPWMEVAAKEFLQNVEGLVMKVSPTTVDGPTRATALGDFSESLARIIAQHADAADKRRLDWLEREGAIPLSVNGKREVEWHFSADGCDNWTARGDTLRAAIDAAMRGEGSE